MQFYVTSIPTYLTSPGTDFNLINEASAEVSATELAILGQIFPDVYYIILGEFID